MNPYEPAVLPLPPVVLLSPDGQELTSNYVVAMQDRFMGGAYLQPPARLGDQITDAQPVLVLVTRWRQCGSSGD
jgi:hypothetical protein